MPDSAKKEQQNYREALKEMRYFSGMFFNPISVPASLNKLSSCFTMFMHTGAPAQAFANSSSMAGLTMPIPRIYRAKVQDDPYRCRIRLTHIIKVTARWCRGMQVKAAERFQLPL